MRVLPLKMEFGLKNEQVCKELLGQSDNKMQLVRECLGVSALRAWIQTNLLRGQV